MLALAPGSYTLRLVARSPNGIQSGRLFWRVTCLPGGSQIGALDLSPGQCRRPPVRRRLHRPGLRLPGQGLSLVAEPGDVAAAVNLEISRMEIGR